MRGRPAPVRPPRLVTTLLLAPLRLVLVVLWILSLAALLAASHYGSIASGVEAPARLDDGLDGDRRQRFVSARGFVVDADPLGRDAWVPLERVSPTLVRAVLAAEDARFFVHPGFDARGLARAVWVNYRHGGTIEGGSTLTQQLAKSFVGRERTLERKLRELALARALERRFTKRELLEAYLNRIYYGLGATGVGAAARRYFDRGPSDLALHESALLAAVIPAPSQLNPHAAPDLAQARRDRVLLRMARLGMADEATVRAAVERPLGLRSEVARQRSARGVVRAARRELSRDGVGQDGTTRIALGVDLALQRRAEQRAREILIALDRRQGYRGPLARVVPGREEMFDGQWRRLQGDWGDLRPARVVAVEERHLRVAAGEALAVERDGWAWAAPFDEGGADHDRDLEHPGDVFRSGDVVLLDRSEEVAQWPRAEIAFGAADRLTGLYRVLIGGFDPGRSEFHRFVQACRQPGSIFKPIVFAAAFEGAITPAELLRDSPFRMEVVEDEVWQPRNADGGFGRPVLAGDALVDSLNLPTIELYRAVGYPSVAGMARRLGVTSELEDVASLPLGASCVAPAEMTRVFGAFASSGHAFLPRVVASRDGAASGAAPPPGPPLPGERLIELRRGVARVGERVIDPGVAWQIAYVLREVVRRGTGHRLSELPFPAAGKTGTTTNFDAWFAGFTARDVAVLWIGTDRNTRPLGRGESGSRLAAPAWGALVPEPKADVPLLGPTPSTIEVVEIDVDTGFRVGEGRSGRPLPFREGTAPRQRAASEQRHEVERIERIERTF